MNHPLEWILALRDFYGRFSKLYTFNHINPIYFIFYSNTYLRFISNKCYVSYIMKMLKIFLVLFRDTISASFEGSDRGAILTTHYMEEADALCSRIGIMINGEMQ